MNGAMLEANLGHYVEAIEASRRANALFEDLGDLRGQTVSMINIAEHALRQGEYGTAEQAGVRGLELARRINKPRARSLRPREPRARPSDNWDIYRRR